MKFLTLFRLDGFRMKNFYTIGFAFFLVALLSGCSQTLIFTMEQLRPGLLVSPIKDKRILIVDNSSPQPSNKGHVVAKNAKFLRDTAFNTLPLSIHLTQFLHRNLSEAGLFSSVQLIRSTEIPVPQKGSEDYLYSTPLPNVALQTLSKNPANQLVLSLDLLHILSVTQIHDQVDVKSLTRDVWLQSDWRVYDLMADTMVVEFSIMDSMYWKNSNLVNALADSQIPPMDAVLEEIGAVLAQKVVKQALPSWEKVDRVFFCNGSWRMRNATDFVRIDDLDQAATLWEAEYSNATFRSKYRAALNLVLYNDVKDRIDIASDWLAKAETAIKESPFGSTFLDEALLSWWKVYLPEKSINNEKLKKIFDEN